MITLVSGLPRSGTSLMMQILEAAEFPLVYTKNFVPIDEIHNPKGFYEWKNLYYRLNDDGTKMIQREDFEIIRQVEGKAVKCFALTLSKLPKDLKYKVIYMVRNPKEVVESYKKLMGRTVDDDLSQSLEGTFGRRFETDKKYLDENANTFSVLFVPFAELVSSPTEWAEKIATFLDIPVERVPAMAARADPSLYRNRIQS